MEWHTESREEHWDPQAKEQVDCQLPSFLDEWLITNYNGVNANIKTCLYNPGATTGDYI